MPTPVVRMAALDAHSGDLTRSFSELDRALRERTGAPVWTKLDPALDPALDPLRADARLRRWWGRRTRCVE